MRKPLTGPSDPRMACLSILAHFRTSTVTDQGPRRHRIADYAGSSGAPAPRRRVRLVLQAIVNLFCLLYAAIVLGFWVIVSWSPPEFWPAHLLLYGPRWVVCLPALLLAPLALWLRMRSSGFALAVAAASFIGLSGFNIPWRQNAPEGEAAHSGLRLLTCNVQFNDLRTADLAEVVREVRPDVVLLQECSLDDPSDQLGLGGWYVRSAREFCVVSRYPIVDFEILRRPDKAYRIVAIRAWVSWNGRTVPVVGVHLMTPRRGLEAIVNSPFRGIAAFRDITSVQRCESALVRRWVDECPGSILLAGDFNLTVEHPLFRRDWSDLTDGFSQTSWGLGYTMFTRHVGLRIDHILCGSDWRPIQCRVGPDVGSAHRPVIADVLFDR
jgi:vancomycin resistance protein VanJ